MEYLSQFLAILQEKRERRKEDTESIDDFEELEVLLVLLDLLGCGLRESLVECFCKKRLVKDPSTLDDR